MRLNNVLEKPIMTEKSVGLTQAGRYSFKINKAATKASVAKAVKDLFGVDAKSVKILVVPGKTRRVRGTSNSFTKTAGWKKAVVQVKAGQKIDMFSKLMGEK
jgi:large subunit ribosomal protein L23